MNVFDWRALGATLCLAWCAQAHAEAPAFIVGVGTHLLNTETDVRPALAKAREAGIDSVRDDAWWGHVELQKGQFGVPPAWGRYLSAQRQLGMSNVLILGYGNSFYNSNAKPAFESVRGGFLGYTAFVTQQLKGQVGYWEIYNEWDIAKPRFGMVGDSKSYLKLAELSAPVIRAQAPDAKVLAGAITAEGIKAGFADRLLQGGVMNYADGLSLHPYVHCEKANNGYKPEHWIGWLRELSARFDTEAGKPVPLYLTEMGWHSTGDRHPCGVSESTQAAFLARSYLLARTLPAIKGMWWYDLVDDGNDPAEQEHNFGLLNPDLSPKPAFDVLKAIAPLLQNSHFEPAGSQLSGPWAVLLSQGGHQQLAAWADSPNASLTVRVEGGQPGPLKALDLATPERGYHPIASQWQCDAGRCQATVQLTAFPLVIDLGAARGLPFTAAQD